MPEELVLIALVGMGMITTLGIGVIRLVSQHLERKDAGVGLGGIHAELAELRERLDGIEDTGTGLTELEERVDFAERLLADRRAQIEPGSG